MGFDWLTGSRVEEITAAVLAVRRAAGVCRRIQEDLVGATTLVKGDRSPVTVADFASQAIVCATLGGRLPGDPIVAEEGTESLRRPGQEALAARVAEYAAAALGEPVSAEQALAWIDRGAGTCPPGRSRFWTLDPIDGTKGFLRGEQYAIALALVEGGEVTLGVLGCPHLSEGLSQRPGTLMVALRGAPAAALPLDLSDSSALDGSAAATVKTSAADPASLRFCESVESAHSDHSLAARIAGALGITRQPLRMDSQAKYASVARGDASIYLRLPTRKDYREKIWDHAAGAIIVEQAGGRVSDVRGRSLDFTRGRTLRENRGVVATCGGAVHERVLAALGAEESR